MSKRIGIGLLATALLATGAWVGVAYGGSGGITQPVVIELTHSMCGEDGRCAYYLLRPLQGTGSGDGQAIQARLPSYDVDGNRAGTTHGWLSSAPGTGSLYSGVETLREGPHTSRGSITLSGFVPNDGCFFGGSVCTFAVTGGTGAYKNVRGHATVSRMLRGSVPRST